MSNLVGNPEDRFSHDEAHMSEQNCAYQSTQSIPASSYEGDPRSNANPSVISSTIGISKNGLHVYYHILSIL